MCFLKLLKLLFSFEKKHSLNFFRLIIYLNCNKFNISGQMFIICRLGKQRGSSIIAKIQALKFNKVRHM